MPNVFARVAVMAAAMAIYVDSAAAALPAAETVTGVTDSGSNDDGSAWFDTWEGGMRFVIAAEDVRQNDGPMKVIDSANDEGRSVRVRYDPDAAKFNAMLGRFEYPVCSVGLEEIQATSAVFCKGSMTHGSRQSPERLLAIALARRSSGAPREAITLADRVLALPVLNSDFIKMTLKLRADSRESLYLQEVPWSDSADRIMLAALADARKLAEMEPHKVGLQTSIAFALQELGDYSGTREILERALKRWPEEDIRISYALVALARQEGHTQRALNMLNGIAERHGAQEGMKFHYHRGWTLNGLGRFDEAIASLTEGLKGQPDYAYAYMRRACAYASLGEGDKALTDLELFATFLSRYPDSKTSRAAQNDLIRAAELTAMLRTQIATGQSRSAPEVCQGFWGAPDKPRTRSPLLRQLETN